MSTQNPVFIPGPTNIPEHLRRAVNVPTMDHRAPGFDKFLNPLFADLKTIFKTDEGEVLIFPSTGTGGWEAAITNTLSPGDKILAGQFGQFSNRWIDLCQRHFMDVQVVDAPWGQGVPVTEYETILREDTEHSIKAVLVTHNETATGVTSDVSAVRRVLDTADHPAMLYVDCVSSLACVDFRMDEWGVDLAVAGSQKGFMLPTGLAIVAASQKAIEATKTAQCPRCFFDFQDMLKANAKGSFPYTPALNLMHGLRESLDTLLGEGLDNVFSRHYRIAEGVRHAVSAWGFTLCAEFPDLYSNTVSAIRIPDGFSSDELVLHAYEKYGVSFGVGLGEMAGKSFRIGHLGNVTEAMVFSGLGVAEMAMKDLGYPIELGSGVIAAQEYYRANNSVQTSKAA